MVLKPFPFPLNVGTDICRISRIFGILSGPRAARFVKKVLTPEEIAAAPTAKSPLHLPTLPAGSGGLPGRDDEAVDFRVLRRQHPDLWTRATFLAGRFAAKEAAFKAHPSRKLTWHEIIIARAHGSEAASENGSGPPVAIIRQGGEEQTAMISISHDGDYAMAVCLGHETTN